MRKVALSIIVPIYNEEKTVLEVIRKLDGLKVAGGKEIILIDDGSTDNTKVLLRKFKKKNNYTLVVSRKNQGKGAAVQKGLVHAKGDYIIIQDADLEYSPSDISRMLITAQRRKLNVLYGSRNKSRVNSYIYNHLYYGGKFLAILVNLLYRQKLTDVTSCYFLIKRSVWNSLFLKERGFGIEVEVTIQLSLLGYTIEEIPIDYMPRTYAEGKKLKVRDGIRAAGLLFFYYPLYIWRRLQNTIK